MPASRRTTLGPVNVNRRTSLGGGAAATPSRSNKDRKDTKPPKGRASMLPRLTRDSSSSSSIPPPSPAVSVSSSAPSRRRSVGGERRRQSFVPPPGSLPTVKTDPRPISDKSYQNQCIKQLLQFLTKSGYEYPISPKSLARPSAKDFSNIVGFMLRKLDPTFQDGTMKFEDEVAMNFKAMGYPYPISKTALVAAGSPHTWPALLAALTWLMEHLKCMEADLRASDEKDDTNTQFESMEDLDRKSEKMFFQFLGGAYTSFLRGDQAMTEQLQDGLVESFESDNAVIEREIERMTQQNAAVDDRMNQLSQHSQSLPALTKKREDYATDLEQFHDLVRQMEDHKAALEQKVEERTADLETTNVKLDTMANEISSLKQTIQSQDLSVEDVRKMQGEQLRVKEAVDRAVDLRQTQKDALWESDVELASCFEQLESVVNAYNTKLSTLALILPNSDKLSSYKMKISKENAHSADQTALLGVDLFADMRPHLSQAKTTSEREMGTLRRELQEVLSALEASEEAFTEVQDKRKIVEDKKARCEETMSREAEQQDAALAVRLREASSLEEKVAALRDPAAIEEQITGYQRQCTQLETLRMKHEEESVAQKKAVQEEIEGALRTIEEHNGYVHKKFAELEQYILRKKASYEKVTTPSVLDAGD